MGRCVQFFFFDFFPDFQNLYPKLFIPYTCILCHRGPFYISLRCQCHVTHCYVENKVTIHTLMFHLNVDSNNINLLPSTRYHTTCRVCAMYWRTFVMFVYNFNVNPPPASLSGFQNQFFESVSDSEKKLCNSGNNSTV